MKSLAKTLSAMQKQINAPKNQYNSFGRYRYRSCEDILKGAKDVLPDGCTLCLNDTVMFVEGRFYIKSEATFSDGEHSITASAFAREEETKKGMDGAQITGSASSYARKYALCGLLAIDDSKLEASHDVDAGNHKKTEMPVYIKNILKDCEDLNELRVKAKELQECYPDYRLEIRELAVYLSSNLKGES